LIGPEPIYCTKMVSRAIKTALSRTPSKCSDPQ
jgi:hypothetical protein